jgi:alginate O-acetyltransferase complex protein AlgI
MALLAACLLIYWSCPWLRVRQGVLFIASAYFYISWSPVFFAMLLFVVALNWCIGGLIERTGQRYWLIFACVLNLALLAYFKYAKFIVENFLTLLRIFEPTAPSPILEIVLPLGISFYVFELISYLVDLYQKKVAHERNPIVFSLFVLFFPHLIAGPICRAHQFIPQLKELKQFQWASWYQGSYLFLAGFALKCTVADGIAPFVNVVFATPVNYSGFDNLMATIGFGVQILCDFWGYSLMALGAALLFGYSLPNNFNAPYAALSIRDFWRRWHITLSNWLRDYLYIALGGSRNSQTWKIQRNLALTMLLGGLWHGASWNFVIWGAIHGVALAINRGFDSLESHHRIISLLKSRVVAWGLTMTVVFTAWIFFRAPLFSEAITMIANIITPKQNWVSTKLPVLFFELLLLYSLLQYLVHFTSQKTGVMAISFPKQMLLIGFLTMISFIYYVDGNQFIYFNF